MNNNTESTTILQYISDFSTSKRDTHWDQHRSTTQNIEAIFADGEAELHQKQSRRLKTCAGRLVFGFDNDQETGESKMRLKQTYFCKVRSCAVCSWRKQLVWQARAFKMMPKIQELYPTHKWLFLTLTVKNCLVTELKNTIRHMQKSWDRLQKLNAFASVDGYMKTVEVTRGADGSAHPHFHIQLLVKSSYFSRGYITQQKWRELWMQSLRVDYLPVVHIQTVKSKNKEDPNDYSAAIVELIKYEMKLAELESYPDFLRAVALQLVRVRALQTGGVVKEIIKDDEATDDEMIRPSDEEKAEELLSGTICFNWKRNERRYKKSKQ